jgi:hypothetical protein
LLVAENLSWLPKDNQTPSADQYYRLDLPLRALNRDVAYIKAQYTKGEDHYTLKENLTVEDKSKIYDIISSTGLDIIDAVDGCQ